MKKRNNYIKILSFFLCIVMLLGFSAFAVAANEDTYAPKEEEYVPVEWKLDEELEYIYGGDKRYNRYYVRGAFYGDADFKFCFMNTVIYNGKDCQVYGDSAYPHIVSVGTSPGYSSIFVDAQGKAILDSFINGINCIYYLEEFGERYAVMEKSLVKKLDDEYSKKGSRLKWVAVNELGEAEIFELTAHDKTETKAYQHGAVYIMPNGKYYYVCFEELDNSYFDSDGYFSYRSGSVQAYELDSQWRSSIDELIASMTPKEHIIVYERSVVNGYYDINGEVIEEVYHENDDFKTFSIIAFFVITIIVGIVIPIILIILGIIWANSPRTCKRKCWYALSASAALWLLSAALFLLCVVV